ncbi:hypothetical protein DBR00_09685 [Pseudomonas sp. HMWF032]|uniref:hypothetical protein n=1 Tax=unclassified Pseudomonas TaxID=196821 RepID=UPI000D388A2A|nr:MULTISPECIES: hypothetical protein [unclassified Pseudomonas]PTS86005.1 hypothetical protein DBR00_09685 [Pseudomonas sp. HMWF032]PTT83587.1 hypothetical protein DBR41_10470 [Pseudomonas sp. HMWF010]WAC45484.1 hypothetical protein OU997_04675 [Pseudomonas sp. SL4(2022)]
MNRNGMRKVVLSLFHIVEVLMRERNLTGAAEILFLVRPASGHVESLWICSTFSRLSKCRILKCCMFNLGGLGLEAVL